MTEYRPIEYVVDLGNYRSNQPVCLSMSLIEQIGAKLHERIIRCSGCKHFTHADSEHDNNDWCAKHDHIAWSVNGFCDWAERKEVF